MPRDHQPVIPDLYDEVDDDSFVEPKRSSYTIPIEEDISPAVPPTGYVDSQHPIPDDMFEASHDTSPELSDDEILDPDEKTPSSNRTAMWAAIGALGALGLVGATMLGFLISKNQSPASSPSAPPAVVTQTSISVQPPVTQTQTQTQTETTTRTETSTQTVTQTPPASPSTVTQTQTQTIEPTNSPQMSSPVAPPSSN